MAHTFPASDTLVRNFYVPTKMVHSKYMYFENLLRMRVPGCVWGKLTLIPGESGTAHSVLAAALSAGPRLRRQFVGRQICRALHQRAAARRRRAFVLGDAVSAGAAYSSHCHIKPHKGFKQGGKGPINLRRKVC